MSPVSYERIAADGALTVGKNLVHLTKSTGVLAATLAAPTNPDMNGQSVRIVSQTAQAHVITATNLINGNNDTLTWGGAIGDFVTLYCDGGEYFTGELISVTVG
ncbi:hypothetical protein LCGC14_2208320 [marine sediment metagenome]|uniref:Uncharacterized protein n=1 Tax=marine sediment metagenome TaxID=412755 RepID=A0A0F9GAE7_9ZZZZ